MTIRKLSGVVSQGSDTIDFSSILNPTCNVRDRFYDLGLDGVIVWEIVDKTILNVPFRYLGVLQVYSHDDLYVIPEIGTGGSKLMQSDLGLYLDSGYVISLGSKTTETTLNEIKTSKNCTAILDLEKLIVERAGNEHSFASIIRIIDGLSDHVGKLEKSLCVSLDLWDRFEASLAKYQTEWASRLLIRHCGYKLRSNAM